MISREDSKRELKLQRLEVARVLLGGVVLVAVFAVILCGINAFTKESDAWLAMRLPLSIAVFLIGGFARVAKSMVTLKAIRRS